MLFLFYVDNNWDTYAKCQCKIVRAYQPQYFHHYMSTVYYMYYDYYILCNKKCIEF